MDAIAAGEVALIVLSGGQGTRLGFDGPKGKYDIGLPSGKTMLQLFGKRVVKLQQLASAKNGGAKCTSPWYIMTSPMNHDETESFFQEKGFFGLEASQVKFFPQGTLPCMTPEGKMMLETGCKVGAASDGNGGIYGALRSKGCLADMETRGIKYIHTYAVDNIFSMRNRHHR